MPNERRAPDQVLDSTNYSLLPLASIQDDPDSPDLLWGAWSGSGNAVCRVGFPTPSGNPTVGAGLQEFRVRIRKTSSGGNAATWSLELWENGSQVAVLGTGTTSSTAGEVVARTWNAASLGTANGSLVECALVQSGGGTGNPNNRRGVEVGAVEWNVTFSQSAITGTGNWIAGSASFSGAGTSESTGTAGMSAAAAAFDAAGVSSSSGIGGFAAQESQFSGTGTVSDGEVTGSAAFVSGPAQAAAVGISSSSSTSAAFVASASSASGSGVSLSAGSAVFASAAASASGTGTSASVGSGSFSASAASFTGQALVFSQEGMLIIHAIVKTARRSEAHTRLLKHGWLDGSTRPPGTSVERDASLDWLGGGDRTFVVPLEAVASPGVIVARGFVGWKISSERSALLRSVLRGGGWSVAELGSDVGTEDVVWWDNANSGFAAGLAALAVPLQVQDLGA